MRLSDWNNGESIVDDEKSYVCSFEGANLVGPMAQLVRAPPCHGGGRGFESLSGRLEIKYGVIAQLGEHLPYKQRVIGSSPIGPIISKKCRYGSIGRAADL